MALKGQRSSRLQRMAMTHAMICAAACGAILALGYGAHAQTMGIATMQPGTLNHTTGTAIAKVLKAQAGLNVLVQPTAGETVILAIVGKGEADFGMANAPEVGMALGGGAKTNVRLIGAIYPLRSALWVRKDSAMQTVADLKGRRVPLGFSAMRALDGLVRAILATGGLDETTVQPARVPNLIRGTDDFISGSADAFFFAFGAPKVREVDVSVGGTRVLSLPDKPGMAGASKVSPFGYATTVKPGPVFIGVDKPMDIYTVDNIMFTHAGVPDDVVYKAIEAMVKGKDDLVAIAPPLREFEASQMYKDYKFEYHPGALKYFKENGIAARSLQQ